MRDLRRRRGAPAGGLAGLKLGGKGVGLVVVPLGKLSAILSKAGERVEVQILARGGSAGRIAGRVSARCLEGEVRPMLARSLRGSGFLRPRG